MTLSRHRSPIKIVGSRQIWVRNFKYVQEICPLRTGHLIMTHVLWLKTHCQCYPMEEVITHNSRTDKRRIFKPGGGVDHVTGHA